MNLSQDKQRYTQNFFTVFYSASITTASFTPSTMGPAIERKLKKRIKSCTNVCIHLEEHINNVAGFFYFLNEKYSCTFLFKILVSSSTAVFLSNSNSSVQMIQGLRNLLTRLHFQAWDCF